MAWTGVVRISIFFLRDFEHHVRHGRSYKPGEAPTVIFNVRGMNVARAKKLQNGSYDLLARELQLYLDPETNEVLHTWHNPYSDKNVTGTTYSLSYFLSLVAGAYENFQWCMSPTIPYTRTSHHGSLTLLTLYQAGHIHYNFPFLWPIPTP